MKIEIKKEKNISRSKKQNKTKKKQTNKQKKNTFFSQFSKVGAGGGGQRQPDNSF